MSVSGWHGSNASWSVMISWIIHSVLGQNRIGWTSDRNIRISGKRSVDQILSLDVRMFTMWRVRRLNFNVWKMQSNFGWRVNSLRKRAQAIAVFFIFFYLFLYRIIYYHYYHKTRQLIPINEGFKILLSITLSNTLIKLILIDWKRNWWKELDKLHTQNDTKEDYLHFILTSEGIMNQERYALCVRSVRWT